MMAAMAKAISPYFRGKFSLITIAAAKEAAVWPEGKEKLLWGAMRSKTCPITSYGRALAIKFFKIKLFTTKEQVNAINNSTPAFLVLFQKHRRIPVPIHRIPPLPKYVNARIIGVSSGFTHTSCIQSKTSASV